jgi:argininosuccinate synthase
MKFTPLINTGGFDDAELKAIEERAYELGVQNTLT